MYPVNHVDVVVQEAIELAHAMYPFVEARGNHRSGCLATGCEDAQHGSLKEYSCLLRVHLESSVRDQGICDLLCLVRTAPSY